MKMSGKLVALAITLWAAGASAAPLNLVRQSEGYTYFNRPGADQEDLKREIVACMTTISGMFRENVNYPGGIVGGLIVDSKQTQMKAANLENCMVVRGWRVVRLPDADGVELSRLPQGQLAEKLRPWVGAQSPNGAIVRVWGNDAAKTATIARLELGLGSRPSLSVRALPPTVGNVASASLMPPNRPFKINIYKTAKPAELAALKPGSAVLVVTLRNIASKEWSRISFIRLGPDADTPAWVGDGLADLVNIAMPNSENGLAPGSPISRTFAFIVPPGRWAVAKIGDLTRTCLGAPYVDVKAGDVVYTGAFDFGRDGLPIDADPKPAAAYLADQPTLSARLRTASWTNGARFRCESFLYALEYPDAPFDPAYVRAGLPPASPPPR